MSNDARLGLVVGLGLVLAVAVTYFPKNHADAEPPSSAVPSTNGAPAQLTGHSESNH